MFSGLSWPPLDKPFWLDVGNISLSLGTVMFTSDAQNNAAIIRQMKAPSQEATETHDKPRMELKPQNLCILKWDETVRGKAAIANLQFALEGPTQPATSAATITAVPKSKAHRAVVSVVIKCAWPSSLAVGHAGGVALRCLFVGRLSQLCLQDMVRRNSAGCPVAGSGASMSLQGGPQPQWRLQSLNHQSGAC